MKSARKTWESKSSFWQCDDAESGTDVVCGLDVCIGTQTSEAAVFQVT